MTDPGSINVLRLCTWLSPALACWKSHAIVMRDEHGAGLGLPVSSVYVHSDPQRILGSEKKKKRSSINFTQPDLWVGSIQGSHGSKYFHSYLYSYSSPCLSQPGTPLCGGKQSQGHIILQLTLTSCWYLFSAL